MRISWMVPDQKPVSDRSIRTVCHFPSASTSTTVETPPVASSIPPVQRKNSVWKVRWLALRGIL